MATNNWLIETNKKSMELASQCEKFLQEISSPFFSDSIIKGMEYMEFFYDSSYVLLSTQQELPKYCMSEVDDNGYFKDIVRQVPLSNPFWFIWSSQENHKHISHYASLNVCNGATIYWRGNNSLKSIQFSTSRNTSFSTASNFYLNNKEKLEGIAKILYNNVDSLLETIDDTPKARLNPDFKCNYDSTQFMSSSINFSPPSLAKKLMKNSLIFQGEEVSLSPTQEKCLYYLVRGKTAKETGHLLGIHYRTVEEHIERIKNKLGCRTKSDLIEKAFENDFIYFIPLDLANKMSQAHDMT